MRYLVLTLLPIILFLPVILNQPPPDKFTVWVMADPHVSADLPERRVLVEAFGQMESAVPWDVALILGDFSASAWPSQAECDEIQSQFAEAFITSTHSISDVYVLAGNHDADDGMAWFIGCLNPKAVTGRDRPVVGWHDFYYFDEQNIRFLMMSDKNDQAREYGGRGLESDPNPGGYPAGKMRQVTFDWLRGQAAAYGDSKILVAAHHFMLMNTTTATELWGGVYWGYHGYFREGYPECTSFICFVGNDKNFGQPIISFLNDNPGDVALWLGAHTHLREPQDTKAGRGPIETRYGTHFVNAGALTSAHGPGVSMSTVLEFTECSNQVRVRRFLHQEWNSNPVGFYAPAERYLTLGQVYNC